MAMTGAERSKRFRDKHRRETFGYSSKRWELKMSHIIEAIEDQPLGLTATEVYRKLSAHRNKKDWNWLLGEINHNMLSEDKLAPVTLRGTGKRGDPYYLRLSEEWDTSRDWDREQEALARQAHNPEAF